MKTLLLLALATCGLTFAQASSGCSGRPLEANVSVSTNTATTLVAAGPGIIHVCMIGFSTATSTNVSILATDSTVLWGPLQSVSTATLMLNGLLSNRRAGLNTGLQIQFATAPASAVGVFISYYISND